MARVTHQVDCYRLGVHIRLLTRCQICFTLGLFVKCFSLKSFSFECVRFKFIINLLMGASLLALAKSIY